MKISKGSVTKEKLTKDEFQAIINKDLDGNLDLCRDIFCALVFTWGSRIGDILQLKYEDISNGRINIIEQKTGKTKSVVINEELERLIDKWKGKSPYYVFPLLNKAPSDPKKDPVYQKHIESKTAIVNRALKDIASLCDVNKKISSHVARHTFALWASQKNIPLHIIQQMLNHGTKSMTENYIKDLKKSSDLDDAAQEVLG
jgi:integrase